MNQRLPIVQIYLGTYWINSDPHGISSGVPQGSHLELILFLVFFNDLTTVVQTDIYADDTLLHQDIDSTTSLCDVRKLQDPITAAYDWAYSWKGRFGNQKTALLCIGRLREDSMSSLRSLTIENEPITAVTS